MWSSTRALSFLGALGYEVNDDVGPGVPTERSEHGGRPDPGQLERTVLSRAPVPSSESASLLPGSKFLILSGCR